MHFPMGPPCDKTGVIEALRRRIGRLEGWRSPGKTIASGCPPLDALLPDGGFRAGTLVEWLVGREGIGVASLALAAAREASGEGGAIVVLDPARQFYPPAAVRLGIDLQRLILVHPARAADETWALDQSLRCAAVGAVVAWPARLEGKTFRRLQLAAEEGGGLGLLIRPERARHEPSWADVRLLVTPSFRPDRGEVASWSASARRARERMGTGSEPPPENVAKTASGEVPVPILSHARRATEESRFLRLQLLRCRGGADDRSIEVEVDDDSHLMRLAARLADPAAGQSLSLSDKRARVG